MSIFGRHRGRRETNTTDERLRKLDDVSPTSTLEDWWSHVKDQGQISEAARESCECEGHGFTWYAYAIPLRGWTEEENKQTKKKKKKKKRGQGLIFPSTYIQCRLLRSRPPIPRNPRTQMPTRFSQGMSGKVVSPLPLQLSSLPSGILRPSGEAKYYQ